MIGDRIRELRERAGLTQQALAEAAGISLESCNRVERGLFEPRLATASLMADVLGVSLDYLAERSESSAFDARGSLVVRRIAEAVLELDSLAQQEILRLARLMADGHRRARRPGRPAKR